MQKSVNARNLSTNAMIICKMGANAQNMSTNAVILFHRLAV